MTLAHTTKTMMRQTGVRLLSGIGMLSFTCTVIAGTLQLGNPTMRDGQYVFPVVLQGSDEDVAALDFRLSYDPTVFNPVSANTGRNAVQAQKQVNSNVAEPGEFVVVLMGFNQNTVAPGEVVEIVMEKIGEPAGGTTLLQIDDPTLATNVGVEVDSRGLGRTIRFQEDRDPENKRDEEDTPDSEDDATDPEENPSDPDNQGNGTDNSSVGDPAGPMFAANEGATQNPMPNTPNTATGGPNASTEAENTGTTAGAPIIVARGDTTASGGPLPNATPGRPQQSEGATTQNQVQDPTSPTADGAIEARSPADSIAGKTPQTTDTATVTPPTGEREITVEERGRQKVPKYATLVLLMVSVPLGIFGILRFIKH